MQLLHYTAAYKESRRGETGTKDKEEIQILFEVNRLRQCSVMVRFKLKIKNLSLKIRGPTSATSY